MKVHIGMGLGGQIKSLPEDFIVEEVHENRICTVNYTLLQRFADWVPKRKRNYLHFTLVKRNLTTQRAVGVLAKALRISKHRLSYAGMKDRVAVTGQRISIKDCGVRELRKLDLGGIVVKGFSYMDGRIYPGNLIGNRFTVTIRGIAKPKEEIKWLVERFGERVKLGVRNYFGEQRFGSRRNNHIVGNYILKEKFEDAVKEFLTGNPLGKGDWRRYLAERWGSWHEGLRRFPKMFRLERGVLQGLQNGRSYRSVMKRMPLSKLMVHSYQSRVFNEMLKEMDQIPDELPLVGNDTEVKGVVGKILEQDGIRPEYFGFRGTVRKSFFVPEGFEVLEVEEGLCRIRFTLPKGSYATVLLRELNSTLSHN